jgi:hypothetical protein
MAIASITTEGGVLTSVNKGSYAATGGTGERILVDYKDALEDYNVTDLDTMQLFADSMSTDTGGNIDLTFRLPSMNLEQIDEGSTPQYQHTKLRSERVSVKEWGIAVGVTRRMIEDSRFNEVELALNEARRAVDRHMTKHMIYAVFGLGDTTLGTGIDNADIGIISPETGSSGITDFDKNIYGGFIASGGAVNTGRLYAYGLETDDRLQRTHYTPAASSSGIISMQDLTKAIDIIGAYGYSADTVMISPAHYKSLLDLADFTTAFANVAPPQGGGHQDTATKATLQGSPLGRTAGNGLVGSLYGLNVRVSPWIPSGRFGVFDLSEKPVAYVERRPLTIEEANPGFGIVGSYMSMRYGLKIVKPEVGCILIHS